MPCSCIPPVETVTPWPAGHSIGVGGGGGEQQGLRVGGLGGGGGGGGVTR